MALQKLRSVFKNFFKDPIKMILLLLVVVALGFAFFVQPSIPGIKIGGEPFDGIIANSGLGGSAIEEQSKLAEMEEMNNMTSPNMLLSGMGMSTGMPYGLGSSMHGAELDGPGGFVNQMKNSKDGYFAPVAFVSGDAGSNGVEGFSPQDAYGALTGGVSRVYDTVTGGLRSAASGAFGDSTGQVGAGVGKIYNSLTGGVKSLAGGVSGGIGEIAGGLSGAAGKVVGDVLDYTGIDGSGPNEGDGKNRLGDIVGIPPFSLNSGANISGQISDNRQFPQFPQDQLNASELLPKQQSQMFSDMFPAGQGALADKRDFLTSGHHIGINTTGSSLKVPNLGLRSEPSNPQRIVSPWSQSTATPDVFRKTLEIGS